MTPAQIGRALSAVPAPVWDAAGDLARQALEAIFAGKPKEAAIHARAAAIKAGAKLAIRAPLKKPR